MKLEGGERLVLKSLADLQGLSTGYVDDARLAVATKMLVEDVRDWLETLEGKGFVERTRLTDGFGAYVAAKGELALSLTKRSPPKTGDSRYSRLLSCVKLQLTTGNEGGLPNPDVEIPPFSTVIGRFETGPIDSLESKGPVRNCQPTRAEMAGDPGGNGTPVLLLFFCLLSERGYMGSTPPPETDDWALDQLRLPSELVGDLTPKRRPPRHRPGDPFIKGPIPFAWIASACRLPGSGLHVAMAYRFHSRRFRFRRGRHWGLDDVAVGLRISANSVRRGLHAAELAGLLAVEREPGCKLAVSVLDLPGPETKTGGIPGRVDLGGSPPRRRVRR